MQATRQSGFSLVELMIALLLGTLVVAAAGGIFLANRQTFRSTDNLGRVQEGMRTAFELMARDIREAAGNPCSNAVPLANVINTPTSRWWTNLENWGQGLRGYMGSQAFADSGFGTGAGQRLSDTEAIELFTTETPVRMVTAHTPASATFTLGSIDHGFAAGDLALACSPRHAALFQISSVSGATIGHGTGGTPGNCTSALGVPVNCGTSNSYEFSIPNTVLARVHAVRWYVANNAAGRPALYQQRLVNG
ncbi:MAG: PilW family protein, partial [Stenotrophomonas sp.]